MNKKLTPKQTRFVHEYIKDGNGKRSAISAGYSKKTARMMATENLSKPYIVEAIKSLQVKLIAKVDVKSEAVITALKELAFFDPRKLFDNFSNLLPVHEWPDDVARCIASIKILKIYDRGNSRGQTIGETVEVKFWSKTQALDFLMKSLGNYNRDMSNRKINLTQINICHSQNGKTFPVESNGNSIESRTIVLKTSGNKPGR